MDKEIYEKYKLAGVIAAEARDYGLNLIKQDVGLLDVANKVESKILDSGAKLAFPVNISINDIAAHYSPKHDENSIFKKGDVVKLDVGAHVDGYIADTAVTVEIGTNKYDDMIKAVDDALDTAISLIKPGVNLSELGRSVQKTVDSYGFKSIDNLTGHSLQRYTLHSGMTIPSVPDMLNKSKPKKDDAIAIEPFVTNGVGHVKSGAGSNIYLCQPSPKLFKLIRDKNSKIMFSKIKNKFGTLPFAQRWFENMFPNNPIILRKLQFQGAIKHYPQLIEAKKGIVTQKEHTVIVTENGCKVTT
jgi:methionyl aminopeptidase